MNAAFALPAVRPGAPPVDFAMAREQMVASQIKPSNVIHPAVLAAVGEVPREIYVPPELQDRSYGDRRLSWGDGFLISPILCAWLLEYIAPFNPEHVLVLESGAGYVSAIAAKVFPQITALFPDVGPAKVALNNYAKSGYQNVTVKSGLLARGWSRSAPYQAIIMAGASAGIPDALVEQLSNGGHVIGLLHDESNLVKLRLFIKLHGGISGRTVADGESPYLAGLAPLPQFRF